MLPQIPIDDRFDLDAALAPPDNSTLDDDSAAADQLMEGMATVVADGGDCAICMESFQEGGGAKRVPCGHIFHSDCIAWWLSVDGSCPLCRFHISAATIAAASTTEKLV